MSGQWDWNPHQNPVVDVINPDHQSAHRKLPLMKIVLVANVARSITEQNSVHLQALIIKESTNIDLALRKHLVLSKGFMIKYPNKKLWRHRTSNKVERFVPNRCPNGEQDVEVSNKWLTIQELMFSQHALSSALCRQRVMSNKACNRLQTDPWLPGQ
jgi:hypothetical protein